jgi:hypothetical protein
MNKTQLVLLAAYALLGFSAHAQNLLVNGSFEAGAFSDSGNGTQQLLAGSTDMSGWTVMTDDVAWITNANPFGVTASEGVMCLDLTGYTDAAPGGEVNQVVPTTVGQLYQLSFDLGVIPDQPTFAGPITVAASAGSSWMSFTHNPEGVGMQWGTYGLEFVATSETTSITIGAVSGQYFVGLDNVVLVAVGVVDSDGDGVSDDIDECPETPAGAIVNSHGCSIEQLVPCAGPRSGGHWKNHGQYVSTLTKTAKAFLRERLITPKQAGAIVSAGARSSCGKKVKIAHKAKH